LGGVSGIALPAASMVVALGVGLSTEASAQSSFNGTRTTTYILTTGTQTSPFTFGPQTNITTTFGDAVDADAATNWNVTNKGLIKGDNYGVFLGSLGTVTNSGSITATHGAGVYLSAGGTIINQAGGAITGFGLGNGVYITGSAGTVTNAGTISASNAGFYAGVSMNAGGSVTNQAGGVITGFGNGVYITGAAGTVTNAGTISASNVGLYIGVSLGAGGSVNNQAGGVITGYGIGVRVIGGAGTVTNAGTITGINGNAVYLIDGGSVTNLASGVITGFLGVSIRVGAGTVTNAGTITGTSGAGVYLNHGGSVTNLAGGVITGYGIGVRVIGGASTVTNAGTIRVTGANAYGVYLGPGGGSVTNRAGGVISGTRYGVFIRTAGTVTNAGTITGGTNSVFFASSGGANVLTLQTGSVLNGTARGSTTGGATNALILQGAGTANNNFLNFNTLDVQGSGVWALGGTSTIGTGTVDSGTLAVTGNLTLTDRLTVNAGGTLGGTGTLATTNGVFINSGGAVQGGVPGAIGTLQVSGNLTFNSGGILATTIMPSGANSLVNVGNTAALTGGAVQVMASSFITHTQTFTVLTANTISGAFSSASLVGTAFARNPRLTEDAHDVFLTVDSGSFAAVLPASATANQVNVAKGIDAGLANGGTLPAGFLALGNLPLTNLPNALTQLSGETATGSQQTTFQAMTQFLGILLDPFIGGRGDASTGGAGATPFAEEGDASAYAANGKKRSRSERDAYASIYTKAPPAALFDARWSVWAAGFGGSQTTDGNATVGSNSATSRIFGTAVGADYRFSPFTIAGFALAGGGTNFSVNGFGTGRSDLFQAGAFVKHTVGPAYISGALAYGWQDITTDRMVTVAGLDRLHAEFNANTFSGRIEGGYRFVTPWIGGIGITPYAAGQFTTFDLPAYAESVLAGTNNFALAYGSKSVTDTRSELGFRTDKSFAMQSGVLTLRGRLAWAHDYNPDRTIAATFQALPGASFVVGGAAQASDSALTTASVEMKWLNGWSAAATFEGEFSGVTRSYAGKGVMRYVW
jgi:uncharacterized protein with beta-barrel porin domain